LRRSVVIKRKQTPRRRPLAGPLKPWLLAAGVVVSFTANAGVRTGVEAAAPGLGLAEDPLNIALAWPTLTAPDIALSSGELLKPDFLSPTPEETLLAAPDGEPDGEAHLQPGFWRGAQSTDGTEAPSAATPEISVLFRLGAGIMPPARPFADDDGGWAVGSFSGLPEFAVAAQPEAQAMAEDNIVVARVAPPVVVPLPPEAAPARIAPAKPVPPKSPLVGVVANEREMKCLAEAVYFEARSEPERGQAGVAQVVLNRARSGVYPSSVCGVVYQNRHKYLACQFTFACEGKRLRTDEPGPWATAQRIARDVAEGRTYLPGVGNATHYHANYVKPWWARYMEKREKVGSHIFYFESAEN